MQIDNYSNDRPQRRLGAEQLRTLGRRGYVVVPSVVENDLIDAALQEIEILVSQKPPSADHSGRHFYWCNDVSPPNPLLSCLTNTPAFTLAESAISPNRLDVPTQIQVSLNLPPKNHRPGGPHLDGLVPEREPDGRPATFTLLAGLFLTDQMAENMGNLWVWPGTHLTNASHFREQGSDALLAQAPYPPTELPEPTQVMGRAGDMLLAHYLLGHNMGGNLASSVRKVIYFRLIAQAHREHWQACIKDTLFEFAPIRAALRNQDP